MSPPRNTAQLLQLYWKALSGQPGMNRESPERRETPGVPWEGFSGFCAGCAVFRFK